MSVVLKSTGGARIGWMNATWPFARLTASAHQLSLSGLLIGTYAFSSTEVADLKPYGSLPLFGRGVQIIHTRDDYPAKMIFWCLAPERLIRNIQALGFRPQAPMAAVPKKDGIPFRWSVLVAMLVLWNALFVLDGFVPWRQPKGPGIFVLIALLMLFVASVAAARSERFQALVLKPGRSVAEIRPVLTLVQFISGVGLFAFAAQHLAG
jgi:hypothetical protein